MFVLFLCSFFSLLGCVQWTVVIEQRNVLSSGGIIHYASDSTNSQKPWARLIIVVIQPVLQNVLAMRFHENGLLNWGVKWALICIIDEVHKLVGVCSQGHCSPILLYCVDYGICVMPYVPLFSQNKCLISKSEVKTPHETPDMNTIAGFWGL